MTMYLRLFDDTIMKRIEEHDVDDPDSGVHGSEATHVLLTIDEHLENRWWANPPRGGG